MDYEEILDILGGFGRYQIVLFIFLGFPLLKSAFDFIFNFFNIYQTNFRCVDMDVIVKNTSIINKNNSYKEMGFAMSASSRIQHIQDYHRENIPNVTFDNQCQNSLINKSICETFEFESVIMHSTLVSEMQLVCTRAWFVPLIIVVPTAGTLVGQLLGAFVDSKLHLGRRTIIFACYTVDFLLTPCTSFMPTIESYIFIAFLQAIPANLLVYQGLILITEITPVKQRSFVANNIWIYWCLGYSIAPAIAYLKPERRFLNLINAVPCLFYIITVLLAVESPRWLLLNGRKEDAIKMLSKIGRLNGKKVDPSILANIKLSENSTLKAGLFESLRKFPKLRVKMIIICVLSFTHSFAYFGISMDLEFANANIFLSTFISGLIEFPSAILGWILCDLELLGRRWSTFGTQLIAGVCLVIIPFIPKDNLSWLKMSVAIIGKLNLTAAYIIFILFIMELLPTPIRTSGMLMTSFVNTAGAIAASFIQKSEQLNFLPGVSFGILAIATAGFLLLLPETRGRDLPETVEESENETVKVAKEKEEDDTIV